jgi:glycosyltransferase involved in cell wall biosynthesis
MPAMDRSKPPPRLRVLLAITHLHAGAAEYMWRLVAGLPRDQVAVVIARGIRGGTIESRFAALGLPMIEMGWTRADGLRGVLASIPRARRLLQRGRFDVVVTNSSLAAAVIRLVAPGTSTPVIEHVIHGWACYQLAPPPMLAAYALAERILGRLTTVSMAYAKAMIVFGETRRLFAPGRAIHLPFQLLGGEAAAVGAVARSALEIPHDAELVVCAARLAPQKGVATLIDAWPAVAQARPRAWLCIVGDGPLRAPLQQRAAAMQRIRWAGWRSDVRACMAAGDIVAVPSAYEPFGIVVLEAMAESRAVVATRVGGIGEMLEHGRTGLQVAEGDAPAMAQAVIGLLADPGRREAMGLAGRRRLERIFVGDAIPRNHLRLWRTLLGNRRGR